MLNFTKIGKRIEKERKELRLSTDALSEKLYGYGIKVTRQSIRKIEKGQNTEAFTMSLLDALADIFQCDCGYLLGEIECRTYDNVFINKTIGLSDDSIKILSVWNNAGKHQGKDFAWARNSIQALNNLVEQGMFFSVEVLQPLAEYDLNRQILDTKDIPGKLRTEAWQKKSIAETTAQSGLMDCADRIYKSTAR